MSLQDVPLPLKVKCAACIFFALSGTESPKIAICMNNPCTCCASQFFFSSTSAQVRGGPSAGLPFKRTSEVTSVISASRSQLFNIIKSLLIIQSHENRSPSIICHLLDSTSCLSPSSCPRVASPALSTSLSLSHVRTMTGV